MDARAVLLAVLGAAGGAETGNGVVKPTVVPIPRPPVDRPNEGTYQLVPTTDGGYVMEDFRFKARVAPDGHVTFEDIHFGIETRVFGVPLRTYARGDGTRPSLWAVMRDAVRPNPKSPPPALPANCQQDVDRSIRLATPCWTRPPIEIVGTFDLTDEVMGLTGQGRYRYEKAKFMSATFEFRVRMAAAYHARLLTRALAELPARLDELWSDLASTPREKRRLLCLLWAEVDTTDPRSAAAADTIVAWIRKRLPSGSAVSYSPGEIAACGSAFAPYSP